MKKAELEEQQERYNSIMVEVNAALNAGLHRSALGLAVSSLRYADVLMRHPERYDCANVYAIDVILKYGPLLLDVESLNQLEVMLKSQRRLAQQMIEDVRTKLLTARKDFNACYRLWSVMEDGHAILQQQLADILGGDKERGRRIIESWEEIGLIRRDPEGGSYRLSLISRLDGTTDAKCSICGAVNRGLKKDFYDLAACRSCSKKNMMVLIPI